MGFGFRLGPIRIGTRSAGVSAGPFFASTGYGRRRARGSSSRGSGPSSRASGPTKSELRDQAITDLTWLLQQPEFQGGEKYKSVPNLPALLSRGEWGAAAEACLRQTTRVHGNTKQVVLGFAVEVKRARQQIQGQQQASQRVIRQGTLSGWEIRRWQRATRRASRKEQRRRNSSAEQEEQEGNELLRTMFGGGYKAEAKAEDGFDEIDT